MNTFIFSSLPVDAKLRITSHFGARNTGIKGASTYHYGVDIGRDFNKPETAILTVKGGKVVTNGWNKYRGWYVVIEHNDKYDTLYQHLKKQSPLKVGQKVKSGDKIGVMGNSSDPAVLKIATHLHFELHYDGDPINPEPYLYNIEPEIEQMTKTELIELIDARINLILKGAGTSPSSWAKEELKKAIADGITDGTRPKGYATREEVAVMVERGRE